MKAQYAMHRYHELETVMLSNILRHVEVWKYREDQTNVLNTGTVTKGAPSQDTHFIANRNYAWILPRIMES